MSSNLINICRACNKTDKNLTNLSTTDVDFIEYKIKLYFCVPTINIDSDKLPQNICSNCLDELRIAYKFKQKCLNSMLILNNTTETILIKQELIHNEISANIQDILIENAIEEKYDGDHSYFAKVSNVEVVEEISETIQEKKPDNTDKELRNSVYNPIFQTLTSDIITNKVISSINAPRRKKPLETPYFCTICNAGFEENEYETHKSLHNELDHISCPLCSRKFYKPNETIQFFRHYCPQHNAPAFLLTCTVCYRKFKSSQALANHKKIHDHGKGTFKCQICDVYFVSMRKLDWHYGNGVHADKITKKLKHV